MEIEIKLSGKELELIPYKLIAETRRRVVWNTGVRKRKMRDSFNENEMDDVNRLIDCALQYNRRNPQEISTTVKDIVLWRRLGDFCYEL